MQETVEELRDVMMEAKGYMSGEVGNSGGAPAWVALWMCMLGAGLENPCARQ